MKEIQNITKYVKRLNLLAELHDDIKNCSISSDDELDIARTKIGVAKDQMLKINYTIHGLIEKARARLE